MARAASERTSAVSPSFGLDRRRSLTTQAPACAMICHKFLYNLWKFAYYKISIKRRSSMPDGPSPATPGLRPGAGRPARGAGLYARRARRRPDQHPGRQWRARLCHLPRRQGEGNPSAGFPRLAGLGAKYLAEQLDAMADGGRVSPIESHGPGARSRPAPGRRRLRLPARASGYGQARRDRDGPRRSADTGAWLATRGAWDKNVPACNQCHGPGGIGVGDNFPRWRASRCLHFRAVARLAPGPAPARPAGPDARRGHPPDRRRNRCRVGLRRLPQAAEQLAAQAAAPGAKQ